MNVSLKEVGSARYKVPLEGGGAIVALDTYGRNDLSDLDYNNNVFCVDADGSLLWRISAPTSAFGRDSFTAVIMDGDKIVAIRESGARYVVRPLDGQLLPFGFLR